MVMTPPCQGRNNIEGKPKKVRTSKKSWTKLTGAQGTVKPRFGQKLWRSGDTKGEEESRRKKKAEA